ncbi:MAG: imidazole glycerol phosphate synthase subunit HisH [Gallionellaceae bacterium]|jgi:glutamine amidotransferase
MLIPNYGCGNLASIVRMINWVGGDAVITSKASDLAVADKIILAGVGAFDHGMSGLCDGGWIDALNEAVLVRRVPILGICLGMQLMCKTSEEGTLPGLGWIDAEVGRFKLEQDSSLKIPHMGWNTVSVTKENPIICSDQEEQRFYFVHSYHVICNQPNDTLAIAHHGYDFTAAFSHENIFGVQFHPEKSHKFGMALMKNFVEL